MDTAVRPFRALGVAVVLALSLIGCQDNPVVRAESSTESYRLVQTASGGLVPQVLVDEGMAAMARDVALALSDPEVRRGVFTELHGSPHKEHKLHFRTLLESNSALADKIADGLGSSRQSVLDGLSDLMDMEFYMPVEAHFATWKGGDDLIVVSFLNNDAALPRAFDLSGAEVPVSLWAPPAIPTLVLIPTETDFARPRGTTAQSIVFDGPLMNSYADSAVYVTSTRIPDLHEPWPAGAPEIEIHTFIEHTDGILYDDICSGDGAAGQYSFDMNSTTWSGTVMLVTQAMLGSQADFQFQVWEDDSGQCKDGGRPPKTDDDLEDALTDWVSIMATLTTPGSGPLFATALKAVGQGYDLLVGGFTDDFIGIFDGPDGGCFAAEGPTKYWLRSSSSGGTTGHVFVDYSYGDRDPVCPLDVQIEGPSVSYECEEGDPEPLPVYSVSIFSGTGSVSYEWREDGQLNSGSGATYQLQNLTAGQHRLDVFVTKGSESDSNHVFINVVEADPESGNCNA